jgi:hypothetical protein
MKDGKFWFNNLSVDFSETYYLECEVCRAEMRCRPPMGEEGEDKILLIEPHQCGGRSESL